jgi:hypothetical protein
VLRRFAGLAGLAAVALAPFGVDAAMQAECEEPAAFAGPVQVFVVQYGFEPDPADWETNDRLQETARRLSYLIQRDVLANDSFGSLAVVLLHENRPGACRATEVQERLLGSGTLRPGQAMALIWGRIFREEDDVYIQSYLRFLRVDLQERGYAEERFTISLSEPAQRLQGGLPTQSVAFAPRKLRASDLDRIDAAWQEASLLHEAPRDDAPAQSLPPPEIPLAYFVHEARPDGWLRIELQFGERGWLKADPEVRHALRELLPELDYVEAVIGYLSYRQAADGRGFPTEPAPWMLQRIEDRFARFRDSPGEASTLALTLLGTLDAFATPDRTAAGLGLLRDALRQQPEDGTLRNLVAMAELRQCCAEGGTSPALQQIPQMLLAGLAVDPNNADLLANLQATYAWLAGQPAGSETESAALATGEVRVNANLRAAPSIDAPVVGLAEGGGQIRINGTDASGQWLRVDRGAEPDAFVAARLIQDLEPAGLQCGRDIPTEICQALRSDLQDAQEFSALSELFKRLEVAQSQRVQETSSRLALAGLTAAEVDTRLQEVQELRQALGELN